MDIINPAPHAVLYPGLDRFKCGHCQRWISASGEIERLTKERDKTSKNKKRWEELTAEIKLEKHYAENCVKPNKS